MPKIAPQKLTDSLIKSLKPRPGKASYKVFDAGTPWPGLYLEVFADGAKRWRYVFIDPTTRKQARIGLGVYPRVLLADAHELHAEAAKMVQRGQDPRAARKAANAASRGVSLFRNVAAEWLEKEMVPNRSESHVSKIRGRLNNYIYPNVGSYRVDEITANMLNELRSLILAKGEKEKSLHPDGLLDTARRVISIISQVFDYAKRKAYINFEAPNPTLALHGSWPRKITRHYSTITDHLQIGQLYLKIENYRGQYTTICALKLSFYLLLRPGELRRLKWKYVDFKNRVLLLPIDVMKASRQEKEEKSGEIAHSVPLSNQAFKILEELFQVTGRSEFVFPGSGKVGYMSDGTINEALKRMGCNGKEFGKIRGHGFRGMGSTILHDTDYSLHAFIEKQLAHKSPDGAISAAYNHAQYNEQRRKMMQKYADFIDQCIDKAKSADCNKNNKGEGC